MSGKTLGTDRNLLGYKLARTTWYQRTLLNRLFKKYDIAISGEQWVVLKIVASSPGLSQTEIAEKTLKDKTNVTRILDVLERENYIQKMRSGTDRRRFEVTVTDFGAAVLESVTPAIIEGEESLHKTLTTNEAETLKALLDKVCGGVKSLL